MLKAKSYCLFIAQVFQVAYTAKEKVFSVLSLQLTLLVWDPHPTSKRGRVVQRKENFKKNLEILVLVLVGLGISSLVLTSVANADESNWQLLDCVRATWMTPCVRPSENTSRRSAGKIHPQDEGKSHPFLRFCSHSHVLQKRRERRHTRQSGLATGQTGEHSHVLLHLAVFLLRD